MRVSAHALWLPKGGNRADEYEDACCPRRSVRGDAAGFRCAVADGATEASFSGLWAGMLVRAYCRGDVRAGSLPSSLEPLREAWRREVDAKPLPWYAEEKRRHGAFSSLLGVTLGAGGSRWQALAVGDSCLFQIRNGRMIAAWPFSTSEAFDNHPFLLSTTAAGDRALVQHAVCMRGDCAPGDMLYLLTDALAQWFLREHEAGGDPWDALDRFQGARALHCFRDWVVHARSAGCMRNDDVTVLRVRLA